MFDKDTIKRLNVLEIASLVLAFALLLCLSDMPYSYYNIVRLATTVIFSCWIYVYYKNGSMTNAIFSGWIVVIFQPFFRIRVDYETWAMLDFILAAIIFVVLFLKLKKYERTENH